MIYGLLIAAFIGLALGSFASAVSWRVPRGQSWIASGGKAEHSCCPKCNHTLSWLDLIPLFSWVFQRGRCRYCKAPIGWRYPLIELSTMGVCIAVYLTMGLTPAAFVVMTAVPFLVSLIVIDLEYMILPDSLNVILLILGAAYAAASGAGWVAPVTGGVLYGGFAWALGWLMSRILRRDALGFGDVKFFAVAGVWLGTAAFPLFMVLSGLFGIMVGIFWKIFRGEGVFPFGPALIVSMLACLLLTGNQGFQRVLEAMFY